MRTRDADLDESEPADNDRGLPLVHAISSYLADVSKKTGERGVYLGLYYGGRRRFFHEGYVSRLPKDVVFDGGCLFRPLLAATALELHERGEIDLSLPIASYFPELLNTSKGDLITGWHLLSHTAGYRGFVLFSPVTADNQPENARRLSRVRGAQSLFWPGHVVSYESSAASLLSGIVARSTGTRGDAAVREIALRPFGIDAPQRSSRQFYEGSVGLSAKAFQTVSLTLGTLLAAVEVLGGWRCAESQAGVSLQAVHQLHRKVADIPRAPNSVAGALLPIGGANGLFIYRDGFLGYDGMSPTEAVGFRFCPRRKVAVVLGISRPARALRRGILRDILDLIGEKQAFKRLDSGHEIEHGTYREDIPGYYVGNNAWYGRVRVAGRHISITATGARGRTLSAISGRIDEDGRLLFSSRSPSSVPTFFRYIRTDEACLMMGMTALKKVPVAWLDRGEKAIRLE